jgi:hypothetical protein
VPTSSNADGLMKTEPSAAFSAASLCGGSRCGSNGTECSGADMRRSRILPQSIESGNSADHEEIR